ncbi:tetratricopeptide repeat protein [Caenispirillum salinarum]|uniref:tetratricopeptide repeat protein n=1 Tax=Caenispirillum salinarum TaxID=859058 RepID=UPI00384FC7C2
MTGKNGKTPGAGAPSGAAFGQKLNAALKAGDLAGARALLEPAVATAAPPPQLLHLLGEVLFNLGDLKGAEARLRQAVQAAPGFVTAWFALGLMLVKTQRYDEAVSPLTTVLELSPDHEGAAFNLAKAMDETGDPSAAIRLYTRALEINPRNGRTYNNIGTLLKDAERDDAALDNFLKATEVEPNLAEGWVNAAYMAEKKEDFALAEKLLIGAVSYGSDGVTAACRAGEFLIRRNRPGDAEKVMRGALAQHPESPDLLIGIAHALIERGQYIAAIDAAREAIEIDPTKDKAYMRLGRACVSSGQYQEGADAFIAGIEHTEEKQSFCFEAGNALRAAKKVSESLTMFLRATFGDDALPEPPEKTVETVLREGRVPDWVVEGVANHKDHGAVLVPMVSLAAFFGGLGDHASMRRVFEKIEEDKRRHLNPWSTYAFGANYDPDLTAEDLFRHYQTYKDVVTLADVRPAIIPAEHRRDRLRIGYMSPDFRSHSMINFIKPFLEHHDRDAVEIYAYAELRLGDKDTQYVQDTVDGWFLTTRVKDEDVAARIRADNVDILVDLAGHTSNNRLNVFPYRPAPASATWLGYLYTTAVPGVDYFIGDHITSPPESAHVFSEHLVRLPHYLACYTPSPKAPEAISPLPADAKGHVTFGNASRLIRLNPRVLQSWADILNRTPGARLRLDHPDYGDTWCADYMRNRLAEAGAPMDRVDVLNSGDYWGFYGEVDIVLDTFPHASGTTTCESMYMGVPVLAIADRPPVGRLGAAMVDTVGHPEWIGWSIPEYVRKAVLMAGDLERLRAVRGTLRDELLRSAICDGARFTRNLEAAYREMWKNACDGRHKAIDLFEDASPSKAPAAAMAPAG